MIQLYKADNDNYEYNGDYVLNPYSCEFKATINSSWTVTLEYVNDGSEAFSEIKREAVIACPTPNYNKQLFRIYRTEKDDESVVAYAFPIFLDAANEVFLMDCRPTNKTGQQALDIMMIDTIYTGISDITDVSTAYYIRKNLIEAISSDDENSFINRWGGEISYNNFQIIINRTIGTESGIQVAFGKNMLGITEEVNTQNMATRIIPIAYNGYMLDGDRPWVDSQRINNYAKVYYKVIEYPDIKMQEDCQEDEIGCQTISELRNMLIAAALAEYENGIDIPEITYNVDMADISEAVGYEKYKELEKIHLGDKADCINKNLNIITKQRVTSITFDCISKRVTNVTLGNIEKNYFDGISGTINKAIQALNDDGTLKGEKIAGVINLMNSKLRAIREVAQEQQERAILFADNDPESPTYGAMAIGTTGFEIASSKDQNGEWIWSTFGTGEGFYANCIIAGVLYSTNYEEGKEGCKIDLDTGIIEANSLQIKGNSFDVYVQETVNQAIADTSTHDIYQVPDIPTLDNYPSKDWYIPFYPSNVIYPSEELIWEYDYSKHIGSIAYLPDGTCYVFRLMNGIYGWQIMEGSDTAYILRQISELKVNSDEITQEVQKVSETLQNGYYTIIETDAKIQTTSSQILQEVSKTYTPYEALDGYATKVEMNSQINQTAESIKSTVSAQYTTKTTSSQMQSQITQNATSITTKVTKGDVSSQISQEAGMVDISAGRFTWKDEYSEKSRNGSLKITDGFIDIFGVENQGSIYASSWYNNSYLSPRGLGCYRNGVLSSYKYDECSINGNLYVSGQKNRVVTTQTYGKVGMNAFETMGAYFADIGSGTICDYECVILFDEKFIETIDSIENYQIIVTALNGKIHNIEKFPGYAVVKGIEGTTFDWILIAKQKSYSDLYADTIEKDTEQDNIPLTIEERENMKYDSSIEDLLI